MVCCRCNRTGRCRNCACVKAGQFCESCLPMKLSNCHNISHCTNPILVASPPAAPSTPNSPHASRSASQLPPAIYSGTEQSLPSCGYQPSTPVQLVTASSLETTASSSEILSSRTVPSSMQTIISSSPPAGQVSFIWGEVDGGTFYNQITAALEKVIIGSQTCLFLLTVPLEICLYMNWPNYYRLLGMGQI